MNKTKALYAEISDVLNDTKQKGISDGDGHGVIEVDKLNEQIEELNKDMIKERDVYIVSKVS